MNRRLLLTILTSILIFVSANISSAARLDFAQNIKFDKNQSLTEVYSLKPKQNLMLNDPHNNRRSDDKIDIKQKSPLLAFVIAAVPGSMIHGLGHYYIDDSRTFKILFITELVSIPMAYISLGAMVADGLSGESRNESWAEPMGIIAFVAFLGTWVYDVVAAPIKARSLIVKRSPRFNISQNVDFKHKVVSMNITYNF